MANTASASLGAMPELAAERHGAVAFLSDSDWTGYGKPVRDIADLATAVHDYADRFWAAGIRAGQVVAVIQRNHIEVQAIGCALNRIGALPALLSCAIEPAELLSCLAKLDGPQLIVDATGLARLAGNYDSLPSLVSGVHCLSALDGSAPIQLRPLDERQPHLANPRAADDRAVITHTSGTTRLPKLAAHSTASLYGMVASQIALSRIYADTSLSLKHLSFVHVRVCSVVMAFLEVAMPLLAVSDPSVEHVRELLLRHRPQSIETHPNVYIQWEPLATDPSRPLAPVHRYISTFDAMHPRTIRAMLAGSDHPDVHYLQGYGQTETGAVTLRKVGRQDVDNYRPRDVGRPVDGAQVRIVDGNGQLAPDGRPGAIESISAGQFRGYIGEDLPAPAASWWPMGDHGRLKPDGSLEVLDRLTDHTPGTESYLALEDELLDRYDELVELVLVRLPGRVEPHAVACPKPGAAFDPDTFAAVAQSLGLDSLIVHVWQWDDLPVTGSYKVRRGRLREMLASQAETAAAP